MMGDGESFPPWAHHLPLFSQRVSGVTMLGGHHAIAVATIGPELLRWKATPPPLCPPALYRRMALPLNVCQAQHGGSRTASQEYTVYNPIWKENMGLKKTHWLKIGQEGGGVAGHAEHFIGTFVGRVPYGTQRATDLKQRSHECSTMKILLCSVPYLVHEEWWICSYVDLWTRS